jgi:predicted metal-dependent hydrolase
MTAAGYLQTIRFGSREIPFHVIYTDRRRLRITVHPDTRISVEAPAGQTSDAVKARVRARAPWIIKQLRYFEQFQPHSPPKSFVSGESFRYLGRQYRLKIRMHSQTSVRLGRPFLLVNVPDPRDTVAVEALISAWYRGRAKEVFERRMDICFMEAKRYVGARPLIRIRRMKRRWGSCKSTNGILLNTSLIYAPVRCIDYVIMHELCHLRHRNHGSKFYRLLSRLMPDWEERRKRLERVMITK